MIKAHIALVMTVDRVNPLGVCCQPARDINKMQVTRTELGTLVSYV